METPAASGTERAGLMSDGLHADLPTPPSPKPPTPGRAPASGFHIIRLWHYFVDPGASRPVRRLQACQAGGLAVMLPVP